MAFSLLIEGDCLEKLPSIANKSVDLVLCDLPYGATRNPWDTRIDLEALWREWKRVLKPEGVVCLFGQGAFTAELITANRAWFKYKIVWVKSKSTNFLNAKKQPLRKHEDICVFYKHGTYFPQMQEGAAYDKGVRKAQQTGSYGNFKATHLVSEGGRYPTDVMYFPTAEAEGQVFHPTQKPVALGRYLIRTFSRPGGVILDNSFGSGSFLVAACLEGRKSVGIEKNDGALLFKNRPVDLLGVARERLNNQEPSSLRSLGLKTN